MNPVCCFCNKHQCPYDPIVQAFELFCNSICKDRANFYLRFKPLPPVKFGQFMCAICPNTPFMAGPNDIEPGCCTTHTELAERAGFQGPRIRF